MTQRSVAEETESPFRAADSGECPEPRPDIVDPFGWYDRGEPILAHNLREFEALLRRSRAEFDAGHAAAAAVFAEAAALSAVSGACGLFGSAALDDILRAIGVRWVGAVGKPIPPSPGQRRRVLHVVTTAQEIGGMTRMIWRWVENDRSSVHSVVLTDQYGPVPPRLPATIASQGGSFTQLSGSSWQLIAKARQLRDAARSADLVVLHVGNRDVIPVLAFAESRDRPALAYLNHADHLFWLGASTWDAVISLRRSAYELCQARRGIARERNLLLPIPIAPLEHQTDRGTAKAKIGLEPGRLVLLSVARSLKYATIGEVSFADAHVPFLKAFPEATLVVLGAGDRPDWSDAMQATGGRILALPETAHTADYYDAADIYVDSFPFVSTTSMIEGALRGVPAVTRNPFSRQCAIFGCDVPGLDEHMVRCADLESYTEALSRLARDAALRNTLGETTRRSLLKMHSGPGWSERLTTIYETIFSLPAEARSQAPSHPLFAELDRFMPFIHGDDGDADKALIAVLDHFAPQDRLRLWGELVRRTPLSGTSVRQLARCWVPKTSRQWLASRLRPAVS
ncbi:hypothetical protein [Afifella sp. IM 167]|uniref:hypothetical protein n=1 Tax=Afifella sp. IM 167 TaxID=2033586 RepID=UPI001CCAB33B|nr:hypothetical protein [Afifella sp. IM 167]MBZ8134450.1 glycosyl transferase family 1 [Afifella sp. IM 167]